MLEKIKYSCKKFASKEAFYIQNLSYRYEQLENSIIKIADFLSSETEDYIGLVTNDDLDTYATIFAILFSGKAFIPINPNNPIERNKSIIEQAGIKLILNSKDFENNLFNKYQIVETSLLKKKSKKISIVSVSDEKDAYILFTSGSTGIPKGVPITRKSLFSFTNAFYDLGYKLDHEDRFLQMFDLTFDLSVMSYFAPVCIGASVLTVPSGEIKYAYVYNLLSEQSVTFALMVPSLLSYLRPFFNEINLPKLKYSLFCGEALYEDLVIDWKQCVPNALIQNVYGPTEATIFCLTYDIPSDLQNAKSSNGIICIGKPMTNMGAIIVSGNSKLESKNEKGELCLYGDQLTNGYWKNNEKNKETFLELEINGSKTLLYRTGDLCYLDDMNDFMYLGRLDHQVKIQGFRVELSEIEHHVREYSSVSNIAAIVYKNKFGADLIHLFIDPIEGNIDGLKENLAKKLPTYMMPNKITELENFPLNVNGKIDRKELKKRLETRKIK